MTDYGTGIRPDGQTVSLTDCTVCGGIYSVGAVGHETPPEPSSTERHKAAFAAHERAAK